MLLVYPAGIGFKLRILVKNMLIYSEGFKMYKYLFGLVPSWVPMSTRSTSTLIKLNAVFGRSQWLEKEVWV